jgi:glycerate dehydrogenase
MRIVILDGYTLNPGDNPWDLITALGELTVYDRTAQDQIIERAMDAEFVMTNKTPLEAETLGKLPNLKYVGVLATGCNVVDLAAAKRLGIPVCNVPEYGTNSVAQHVFSLILALCNRPVQHDQLIREGEWTRRNDFSFWDGPLIELTGKRLGIVGYGRIGHRVAELGRSFGMKIATYSPDPAPSLHIEPIYWKSLEEIFAESDVVSLHCPQTEDNVGMVDRRLLSLMKPTAFLINTARGGLINEQDLADALNEGTLAGAGLDVLSVEPPLDDNPLLTSKNTILTPHIAWAALEARKRLTAVAAENIAAFVQGRPVNIVNGVD